MKRPYIPLEVRLHAALRQLGLDPATAELDHDPALELRERVPIKSVSGANLTGSRLQTTDGALHSVLRDRHGFYYTVPDANDPRYLVWRDPVDHSRKTNGPGGEKRITTRGGDHGDAAHLRALTTKEAAFRRRLLAKVGVTPEAVDEKLRAFKRKIPPCPFPKRPRA